MTGAGQSDMDDGLPLDQQLCTSCGLCCDGTLFTQVHLEPRETERAATQGLPLINGGDAFSLPCGKLHDCKCAIYAERPAVCAAFRCRLLERFDAGEVGGPEALEKIAVAREMADGLRDRLPSGATLPEARAQASHFLRHGAPHPTNIFGPELLTETVSLMLFLDRHFRRAGKADLAEGDMAAAVGGSDRGC